MANRAATVSLNLTLNAASGNAPAGLQWTFSYASNDVLTIAPATGPALTAAGKTLNCRSGSGSVTCVASGRNSTPIGNGVVAVVAVTLNPLSGNTVLLPIGSVMAALPDGKFSNVAGSGGTISLTPGVSRLNCSPASIPSGSSSTCTITLTQTAPSGGASVAVTDNNAALTVPASVTVPAGATSANFTANAGTVTANQAATVTASLNGSAQTASVTVTPAAVAPTISGLQCAPATVSPGGSSICTVTLASAALTGGASVAVSDNNAALTVPASVTVPAGGTTANFTATAGTVTSDQTVTVTASLNGSSRTATVTLSPLSLPGSLSSLQCAPATVSSGGTSTCTVTLSQPAPIAALAASTLAVPGLVGAYAFDENSGNNASDASGSDNSGTLVSNPAWTTGKNAGGLRLNGSASYVRADSSTLPTGDFTWMLWVKANNASPFQTLMGAQGSSIAELEFNLQNGKLSVWSSGGQRLTSSGSIPANTWTHVALTRTGSAMKVYINGQADGATGSDAREYNFGSCPLLIGVDADSGCAGQLNGFLNGTIDDIRIYDRALSEAQIQADMNAAVTPSAPGPGATLVTLSNNNPALTVPASVSVPGGATTANFSATAGTVMSSQAVMVTASLNGNSKTAMVTVMPASAPVSTITSLQCTPASITSGGTASCTVALSPAAPSGGASVALSDNNAALTVPASVTVPAGSTTASFAATAGTVTGNQAVTVTASLNGSSKTASVTVTAAPVMLQCTPATIASGGKLNCTVTLSQAAPAGGTASAPGLVGAYAFNEGSGTSASDASGSGNAGTLVNNAAWTSGKNAGGLLLNGSASYVRASSAALPTGDFTWMLWVKANNVSPFQTLMEAQGSTIAELEFNIENGKLSVWSSGAQRLISKGGIPANTWTHVALTRTGSAMKMYVNGVADSAAGSDARAYNFGTCPLLIGVDSDSGCTGQLNGYLNGTIDDIRIYNRALSQAQIQSDMNTAVGPSGPGGVLVTLSSSNSALTVPGSVTVAAGTTAASFTATAGTVSSNQNVTITATVNGNSAKASATVTPAAINTTLEVPATSSRLAATTSRAASADLSCSPRVVDAGSTVTCDLRVAAASRSRSQLGSSSSQVLLPAEVAFRDGQSQLSFQVSVEAAAKRQAVTLTAEVDGGSVQETIQVDPATAPVLTVPGPQFARFGKALRFQVSAVDTWELPVDVVATGLPKGATFDPQSGWFEWVPGMSDAGKRQIVFTATNVDRKAATANVTIDVDSGAPVLNAESNLACSPGAIATLRGKWLAEGILSEPSGRTLELGGARVKLNDQAVPLVYTSPTRVSFLCPALDPGAPLAVAVETADGTSKPLNSVMQSASPEIFSLDGNQGMISFGDSSDVVSQRTFRIAGSPAQPGDTIRIWGTGLGFAQSQPGSVRVKVGDEFVSAESIGEVPGNPGIYAVQVRVPRTAASGSSIPVQLQASTPDGKQLDSNSVTMAVEPAGR